MEVGEWGLASGDWDGFFVGTRFCASVGGARSGVPEYWIVRPASRDLLLCTQPDAALGDYAGSDLIAPDGTLISPTLPVRTPIARFFADAPDTTW